MINIRREYDQFLNGFKRIAGTGILIGALAAGSIGCGGGEATPAPSPTYEPTSTSTVYVTPSPPSMVTITPSPTPPPTSTPGPTQTPTPMPTATSTSTPLPTIYISPQLPPAPTQSPSPTSSPSPSPTASPSPTSSPTPSPTASPSPSPIPSPTPAFPVYLQDSQILFVERNNDSALDETIGRYDLRMMNADGTERITLIDNAEYIFSPTSSPDGSMIALYYKENDGDEMSLAIFDRTGQILQQVKCSFRDPSFNWTPDGKRLIYGDYTPGIYELDAQTGEKKQILATRGFTFNHSPAYTSDESKLAFVHHEFGGRFYACLIDDFDPAKIPYRGENRYGNHTNPEIELLLEGFSGHDDDLNLQWTPNNQKLVFHTESFGGIIYVADVVDKSVLEIKFEDLGLKFYSGNYMYKSYPELSPDGTEIAIAWSNGLYLINIDGTNLRKVAEIESHDSYHPTWSTDNRYITFMSSRDIYIASRDGKELYDLPDVTELYHSLRTSDLDWYYDPSP